MCLAYAEALQGLLRLLERRRGRPVKRKELEARVREIVRKVAEAERLGGGFRLYFEIAVTELVKLVDETKA